MGPSNASLSGLPDEVLHAILCYSPASSIVALEQASRRFKNATNTPLLWRLQCQKDFTIWDPRHDITHKLASPVSCVRWKDLYATRRRIDIATAEILDSILTSQTGRIKKIYEIIGFGYDAKNTLLRHAQAGPELDDHLARRYYSNATLSCLHRTIAINEWDKLRNGEDIPLERALGAFDMFILGTGPGDFNDVPIRLDGIVTQMLAAYPNIRELSPRIKALNIAQFLRERNLVGIEPGREYHNVEHNFLGVALMDGGHNSLPLISAAIYCYVARQFELNANPCGFPFHVHVIIRPADGYDMDGNRVEDGESGAPMYMDPFRSTKETPVSELQDQLNFLGALTLAQSTFLRESLAPEIVLRCGKNILNSVIQTPRVQTSSLDYNNVKYAALWSSMLFSQYTGSNGQDGHLPLRRHLPALMDSFATDFPSDVYLIERYLIPLFENLPEYEPLRESVRVLRAGDDIPKQVRRRTAEHKNVKYKVGQVFCHRRYEYTAVITGWDTECGAGEQWMQRMGIDELSAGRYQSFYHVLVADKSVRYVAEENIDPITPELSELPVALLRQAGKHFKRWDPESRMFVSNIRDEYPDD
ncbi:hypothetical protein FQN50_001498 [Emmonsiellopsis sp. PD_5]|nr:hypothetical protein FQN50_001498 [Emmonsiellopsis sp. PD_5]